MVNLITNVVVDVTEVKNTIKEVLLLADSLGVTIFSFCRRAGNNVVVGTARGVSSFRDHLDFFVASNSKVGRFLGLCFYLVTGFGDFGGCWLSFISFNDVSF